MDNLITQQRESGIVSRGYSARYTQPQGVNPRLSWEKAIEDMKRYELLMCLLKELYADYPYDNDNGFNFLGPWSIRCHATERDLPRLSKISSDAQLNILAPAEGSGLIFRGDSLRAYGLVWSIKNGSVKKLGSEAEIKI